MPANNIPLLKLPDDFDVRCAAMRRRLEANEAMTIEYIADQLGMPFEFFAAALAVYSATVYGVSVEIDATSRETAH